MTRFLSVLELWEFQNKYDIMDSDGTKIYSMKEKSSICQRLWCGNARKLKLHVKDDQGQEILTFDRPLRCMQCCCQGCYPDHLQVGPVDNVIETLPTTRPALQTRISHEIGRD